MRKHASSRDNTALSTSATLAALVVAQERRDSVTSLVTTTRHGHSDTIGDTHRAGTVAHLHVHHHSTEHIIDRDTTVLSTDQVHTTHMHDATGTTKHRADKTGMGHQLSDQSEKPGYIHKSDGLHGLRALLNDPNGIAFADAQHDGLTRHDIVVHHRELDLVGVAA